MFSLKLKKKKGEFIDHVIVILIGIFSFFVIIMTSMNYIEAANKYMDANVVARKYLLRMESHGYLNQNDAGELEKKLGDLGLSQIDLSGTTFSEVENGGDIYLDIKYTQKITTPTIDNFTVKFSEKDVQQEMTLSSTSKD